jgi:hypothetical protein
MAKDEWRWQLDAIGDAQLAGLALLQLLLL